MKTTDNRIAGATQSPVYQLKGWNWLGRVDWTKWKRRDPAGTLCGTYGYLAYCGKCCRPFASKDFLYATDEHAVCEKCTPDRKLCPRG